MPGLQASAPITHEVIRGESPVAQDRADTANPGYVGFGPTALFTTPVAGHVVRFAGIAMIAMTGRGDSPRELFGRAQGPKDFDGSRAPLFVGGEKP